ncbi:MAG: DUF3738 domain-containing protein [Pedobacter sp.]|nr:MAG: DUF3738 domain-containing protein [Pedobacter sp.]
MKRILLIILLILNIAHAQIQLNDFVPALHFSTVINSPLKEVNTDQLKGKLIWIEFWATWCGPCVSEMPKLQALQDQFKDQLQVITVTAEPEQRIKQFLKAKPSNLWFAIDTVGNLAAMFPHRLIPHSVLISPSGKLIALTAPENITEEKIKRVLKGEQVEFAEKKDNLTLDFVKTYFFAEDTVKSRFLLQPEIKGAPGMMVSFADQPAFAGRRLTFTNVGLETLYSKAFGDFPFERTINEAKKKIDTSYCLDIIVENKDYLIQTLKSELLKRFELQAKIEKKEKEVYVLKIANQKKFDALKRNKGGVKTYFSMHGKIDRDCINMIEFAEFLEGFGTYKSLVLDETANKENFDVKFSFQPENPESLTEILSSMGLVLKKAKREVEFLILY